MSMPTKIVVGTLAAALVAALALVANIAIVS
jgi:hypothetical protein